MKSKVKLTMLAAALVLLTAPVNSQNPQSQESATDALGFTDLTLELIIPKQSFVQFEPIPLTFRISNKTTKQAVGHNVLILGTPYLNLFKIEEGVRRRRIPPPTAESVFVVGNPVPFEPGGSYSRAHLWTLSLGETFPREGQYRIQAELRALDSQDKITSNVVTIDINAPTGIDYEAVEFLKSNAKISNFFNGVYSSRLDTVREFISRFGDSTYGDHAIFMLGKYYFLRGEYENALEQFTRLAPRRNFVFAEKVSEHIENIKERLENANAPPDNYQ